MDSEHPRRTDPLRWHHSLRTRMSLWSGLLNAVLVLATTLAFYAGARLLIVHNARIEARALTGQTARNLEAIIDTVQVSGRTLAAGATGIGREPLHLRSLLLASLAGDPDIAGAMVIVEPGRLTGEDPGFTWYIRREGAGVVEQSVESLGYEYATMPWFVRTMAAPQPWWSEPYANEATAGVDFTTYNLPLRLPGDSGVAPALGMVSLDVPVSRLLRDILEGLPETAGIVPMLFSPEGLAVVHPRDDVRMRMHLRTLVAQGRGDLAPLVQTQERRQPVEFEHRDAGGEDFITFGMPVGDSGWTFATSVSELYILRQLKQIALWVALIGLLALLPALVLVRRYTGRLLEPIENLTESARHFAGGEFDYPLPHTGRRDEVGVMARAFNVARGSIKRQLREIEEMAGARQKAESELGIARQIQQAMLPPPRLFERDDVRVDVHGVLEPAKAVGGDFFQYGDFDGVLWFAIGDVSDKGVPAALFMARTATVLEGQVRRHASPAALLASASRRLVHGNDTCMFATVLCGRLDIASGHCVLASAGHDPPVLLHADGRVEPLALETGPPLGFEPCDAYPQYTCELPEGATLLAYTDGVTEAFDAHDEAYGAERLLQALPPDEDAARTCQRLLADVQHFAGDAAQSDDITVLAIRRTRVSDTESTQPQTETETAAKVDAPFGPRQELPLQKTIAGDPAHIAELTAAVESTLVEAGVDDARIHDARLIVEELACNALTHGASETGPQLRLRLQLEAARLVLELDDDGLPFDPTTAPAPDLDAELDERRVGGLGLHLVRQLADSLDYQRREDHNLVRVTLRLDAAPDPKDPA
nr:SpoIIE family protein phosphatase [Luteimonas saliphila]